MFSQVSLPRVRARLGVAVVSVFAMIAAGAGLSAAAAQSPPEPPPPPFSACWSAGSSPTPFSDVPADSWYADAVSCLAELGVTTGTSPSTFSPDDAVTRAQMALFLARLADVTLIEPAVSMPPFEDLAHVSDEVRDAVAVIYGLGVTTGTSTSTFSPDDTVTRAQMALFLARFAAAGAVPAVPDVPPFEDLAHVSDEVRDAVAVIYGLGVTAGTSTSTFSPDAAVTRAQMAGFIARVYRAVLYAHADDQPAPTGVAAVAYRSADPAEALTATVSWDPVDGPRIRYEVQVYDPADPAVLWPAAGVCMPGYTQPSPTATLLANIVAYSSSVTTGELSAEVDEPMVRVRSVASVTGSTVDGPLVCSEWVTAPLEILSAPAPVSGVDVEIGNESLLVSWQPPAADTAAPVSGYRVVWRGGRDAPSSVFVDVVDLTDPAGPSYRISDLVNGRGYTVSVVAVNMAGESTAVAAVPSGASSGVNSWVPAVTAATAPQNMVVVPDFDDGSVLVSWVAPTDTGGSVLQSFTVEYRCGDVSSWAAAAGSPVTFVSTAQAQLLRVSGLPKGATCEFRVAAVSSLSGDAAVMSGFATAETVVAEAPGAPTGVTVQPAHEALLVSWQPPADDGGSPVTGFKVFYASGGDPEVVLVPGAATSTVVSGLLNRFAYTVSVSAVSDAGESPRSAVSAPVQPTSVPSEPLSVTASPPPVLVGAGAEPHDGTALVVSWEAPASNGTEPVTGFSLQYRIAAVPESAEGAGDARPAGVWSSPVSVDMSVLTYTVTGLTQGVAYDVRVAAVNDSDLLTPGVQPQTGLFGYADPAVPATFPGVVSDVDVESGFRTLTVSWSPPADTGGAEITHYWVRHALNRLGTEPFSNPGLRVDAPALRVVLTELEQDAPYVVYVFAVNSMGDGTHVHTTSGDFPESTTLGVPSAPDSVSAESKKAETGGLLLVSWTEVTDSNGGGPIAGYRVETRTGISGPWVPVDSNPDFPGQQDFVKERRSAEVPASVGAEVTARVRAVTTVQRYGSSGYAPSVTVLAVPAAPLSVSASVVEDMQGAVDVLWTHAAQSDTSLTVSGYLVQWFPVDPASMYSRGQRVVSGAEADSFRIEGLEPQVADAAAGVYTIRVAAVNSVGESSFVVVSVSVTVDPPARS